MGSQGPEVSLSRMRAPLIKEQPHPPSSVAPSSVSTPVAPCSLEVLSVGAVRTVGIPERQAPLLARLSFSQHETPGEIPVFGGTHCLGVRSPRGGTRCLFYLEYYYSEHERTQPTLPTLEGLLCAERCLSSKLWLPRIANLRGQSN